MRSHSIAACVAAIAVAAVAGCSRTDPPASASSAIRADAPAPGAVDSQVLEQALERTMNRFAKLDLNGDGKLSAEELNAATDGGDATVGDVAHPRQGRSARAFDNADANGDGVVTREEAAAQARAGFQALSEAGHKARAAKER